MGIAYGPISGVTLVGQVRGRQKKEYIESWHLYWYTYSVLSDVKTGREVNVGNFFSFIESITILSQLIFSENILLNKSE